MTNELCEALNYELRRNERRLVNIESRLLLHPTDTRTPTDPTPAADDAGRPREAPARTATTAGSTGGTSGSGSGRSGSGGGSGGGGSGGGSGAGGSGRSGGGVDVRIGCAPVAIRDGGRIPCGPFWRVAEGAGSFAELVNKQKRIKRIVERSVRRRLVRHPTHDLFAGILPFVLPPSDSTTVKESSRRQAVVGRGGMQSAMDILSSNQASTAAAALFRPPQSYSHLPKPHNNRGDTTTATEEKKEGAVDTKEGEEAKRCCGEVMFEWGRPMGHLKYIDGRCNAVWEMVNADSF
eukprot:GHVS01049496.1.p1 GENE.GHVS01049496.1~~GHVS01049496.1.p1  ORF type:complete len:324 (-),score=121.52 GHVS01049496.1:45-923(-)